MNSLVVLLSVMALAAAEPSGYFKSGFVSYAAPSIAVAPSAVSHQSRVDIKSSPAIVAAESVAPLTRAVISAPAIVAAPATYAAPIGYAAPATYIAHSPFTAPTAYAAPFAVAAPAAISSQSRVDIKSSPAVINTFAAPLLNSLATAPVAYSAPIAAAYTSSFYAPAIIPAAPVAKSAATVDAAALPVAPTETPEVAAARAAHLEAKALEESHKIQKRSLGVIATGPVVSSYSATPVISSYAGPIVYPSVTRVGTPIAVSAPVLTSAYGIHHY